MPELDFGIKFFKQKGSHLQDTLFKSQESLEQCAYSATVSIRQGNKHENVFLKDRREICTRNYTLHKEDLLKKIRNR